MKSKLSRGHEKLVNASNGYKFLLSSFTAIVEKTSTLEDQIDSQLRDRNDSLTPDKGTIQQVQALLENVRALNEHNIDAVELIKGEIEALAPRVYDEEPPNAAAQDVEKLNAAANGVLENWTNIERDFSSMLGARADQIQGEQGKFVENNAQVRNLLLRPFFLDSTF